MSENTEKELKEKYASWKSGKLSNDEFMTWLIEKNDDGDIEDSVYYKVSDEVDSAVFSENDVAVFG